MDDHFREVTKLIRAAKGAKRPIRDVELTRYGCYMLVLSSDSSKPIVSHAKEYFAEQTRRQELADVDTFAQLSEDEKRLIYRAQLGRCRGKKKPIRHTLRSGTRSESSSFMNWGERHPKNYPYQRKVSDNLNKRNNSGSNTKINSISLSLHRKKP